MPAPIPGSCGGLVPDDALKFELQVTVSSIGAPLPKTVVRVLQNLPGSTAWETVGCSSVEEGGQVADYLTGVVVGYEFACCQRLRVEVHEVGGPMVDLVVCALSDLLRVPLNSARSSTMVRGRARISIRAVDRPTAPACVLLRAEASKLDRKDLANTRVDAFLRLARCPGGLRDSTDVQRIAETEVKYNDANPRWSSLPVPLAVLQEAADMATEGAPAASASSSSLAGSSAASITGSSGSLPSAPPTGDLNIQVLHAGDQGQPELIGESRVSPTALLEARADAPLVLDLTNAKHRKYMIGYKNSGTVNVSVSERMAPTFAQYVRSGRGVRVLVGVDMSLPSNGKLPGEFGSLHYNVPGHENPFMKTLRATLAVLEPYRQGPIVGRGFCAKIPQPGKVKRRLARDFPLEVSGTVDEFSTPAAVEAAYSSTLSQIKLGRETARIEDVLSSMTDKMVGSQPTDYFVIVLLLAGDVFDTDKLKRFLVDYANSPVSLVLACISPPPQRLLSVSDEPVRVGSRYAARDILHIFNCAPFLHDISPFRMTREMLSGIPASYVEYCQNASIFPDEAAQSRVKFPESRPPPADPAALFGNNLQFVTLDEREHINMAASSNPAVPSGGWTAILSQSGNGLLEAVPLVSSSRTKRGSLPPPPSSNLPSVPKQQSSSAQPLPSQQQPSHQLHYQSQQPLNRKSSSPSSPQQTFQQTPQQTPQQTLQQTSSPQTSRFIDNTYVTIPRYESKESPESSHRESKLPEAPSETTTPPPPQQGGRYVPFQGYFWIPNGSTQPTGIWLPL